MPTREWPSGGRAGPGGVERLRPGGRAVRGGGSFAGATGKPIGAGGSQEVPATCRVSFASA